MIKTILELLLGIVQAIPLIARFFPPKTPATTEGARKEEIRDEMEEFKETGRPKS